MGFREYERLIQAGDWEGFARLACSRLITETPTEIIDGLRVYKERDTEDVTAGVWLANNARCLVPALLTLLDGSRDKEAR